LLTCIDLSQGRYFNIIVNVYRFVTR